MLLKNKLSIVAGVFLITCISLLGLYVSCLASNTPFIPCLLTLISLLLCTACFIAGVWFIIRAFL